MRASAPAWATTRVCRSAPCGCTRATPLTRRRRLLTVGGSFARPSARVPFTPLLEGTYEARCRFRRGGRVGRSAGGGAAGRRAGVEPPQTYCGRLRRGRRTGQRGAVG